MIQEKIIKANIQEKSILNVTSEIGKLKRVLLHRPGKEVEHLIPSNMERLLFDDIPFLPTMQMEHDVFASRLKNQGIEVLYLEELVVNSIQSESVRAHFIDVFLRASKNHVNGSYEALKEFLFSLSPVDLVKKMMEGVLKKDLDETKKQHLDDYLSAYYPFYLDPMPNLYFTRDPAAVIGNGISLNKMLKAARKRESIFMEFILEYHPDFKNSDIPRWLDRTYPFSIEGGDILVLNDETLAIGVSERTSARAIEKLAQQLLSESPTYKRVIAVEIPKKRAFMHLDTVFTMVDRDKFTIHPEIEGSDGNMNIFLLELSESNEIIIKRRDNLLQTLKEVLSLSEIALIPCGGGDAIFSPREQWNDGSNTLAIAPGIVITYDRNQVTNELLKQNGIKVIEVPSSELSRGRGGPRCMSMPLTRDNL